MSARNGVELAEIIDYLEGTAEDEWLTDRCRSQDGTQNCVMGHIFNWGGGEKGHGSVAWDQFEERYATTFMIFPVNDGKDERYQQPTPKQRVLAYLRDMAEGRTPTTRDLAAEYEREWESEQGGEG